MLVDLYKEVFNKLKYNVAVVTGFYRQHGIHLEPEYKFLDDRKFRFDFAIPDLLIAIEIEGGIWTGGRHTRGAGYRKDMEKYNLATVEGWRILRFTPQDICMNESLSLVKKLIERQNEQKRENNRNSE